MRSSPSSRDGSTSSRSSAWPLLYFRSGRLVSRNGCDHTRRFDDIAAISKLSARSLVLDGGVAIYDQQLRSRFEWLREPDPDAIASPPFFMVFDLLYQDHGTTTNDERSSDRTVIVS